MIGLISLMMVINTLFIFLNHPLSMGMALIAQTIMIAIFSGMLLPSFWYSYILVLVFLGGLLILFVYVSTMASNEQISTISPMSFTMTMLLVSFSLFILIDFIPAKLFLSSDYLLTKQSFAWMFSSPSSILASFLMVYLFIVLMGIVKITKFWGGSMRPLNN